jgi:hypothetical protein
MFLETWYGLFAQFEGQRIGTRLYDTKKRFPTHMIGYTKVKKENTRAFYKANKETKKIINHLFQAFSQVETREELVEVILSYHTQLDRSYGRILNILKTPFFAAHYLDNEGHFLPLEHVEPMISLELFKKVLKKLESFDIVINEAKHKPYKEGYVTPFCGDCLNELTFQKGKGIGEEGKYLCKKHRKNSISIEELNCSLNDSIQNYVLHISSNKLEDFFINCIKKVKSQLNKKRNLYIKEIEDESMKICLQQNIRNSQKAFNHKVKEVTTLRDNLITINDQQKSLDLLIEETNLLVSFINEKHFAQLSRNELELLSQLLVAKTVVKEDSLIVYYYFNEFQRKRDDLNEY